MNMKTNYIVSLLNLLVVISLISIMAHMTDLYIELASNTQLRIQSILLTVLLAYDRVLRHIPLLTDPANFLIQSRLLLIADWKLLKIMRHTV